jgi:N-acetylmuramic acid 6-phosphate etherase
MIENLLTEQRNPASADIDAVSTEEMLGVMNGEDRKVADAVAKEIPAIAKAVDAIAAAMAKGGRLFYIGAGTSGRLGVLDASECRPTFSVPAEMVQGIMAGGMEALYKATEASEDDAEAGARDLVARGFTPADSLVGIAASGRTPYVLGAVRAARKMGAVTAGISCTPDSELSRAVEFPIAPTPGPEIVAGSTRLKAGTATKLVLNMISTGVMIRLGYVYGNLMVNVQPSNEKLVDRARRIISAAAGVEYARAGELLEAGGRNVPVAIVMAKLNVAREEAERRLAAARGRLRAAIGEGGAQARH